MSWRGAVLVTLHALHALLSCMLQSSMQRGPPLGWGTPRTGQCAKALLPMLHSPWRHGCQDRRLHMGQDCRSAVGSTLRPFPRGMDSHWQKQMIYIFMLEAPKLASSSAALPLLRSRAHTFTVALSWQVTSWVASVGHQATPVTSPALPCSTWGAL